MTAKRESPNTICVHCKWHACGERKSEHWVDQKCTHPAVQREPGIDPVFGKPAFYSAGQPHLGQGLDCQSPYCTEINTMGECPYYKAMVLVKVIGKLRCKG